MEFRGAELPGIVLLNIFSHLRHHARQVANDVCTEWNYLIENALGKWVQNKIKKTTFIFLENPQLPNGQKQHLSEGLSLSSYEKLETVMCVRATHEFIKSLDPFSKFIKHLSLPKFRLGERITRKNYVGWFGYKGVTTFSSLRHFDLSSDNSSAVFSALNCLPQRSQLERFWLSLIESRRPGMPPLSISSVDLSHAIDSIVLRSPVLTSLHVKTNFPLLRRSLLSILKSSRCKVEHLEIPITKFDDVIMRTLINFENLKSLSLEFFSVDWVTPPIFDDEIVDKNHEASQAPLYDTAKTQNATTSKLSLQFENMNCEELNRVLSVFPKLKRLTIEGCVNFTDKPFTEFLKELPHLESIRINTCTEHTREDLLSSFLQREIDFTERELIVVDLTTTNNVHETITEKFKFTPSEGFSSLTGIIPVHSSLNNRKNAGNPFEALDNPTMIKIFSFMNTRDKRKVSRVCKKWYDCAEDVSLYKNINLGVYQQKFLPHYQSLVHKYSGTTKYITCYEADGPDFVEHVVPYCESLVKLRLFQSTQDIQLSPQSIEHLSKYLDMSEYESYDEAIRSSSVQQSMKDKGRHTMFVRNIRYYRHKYLPLAMYSIHMKPCSCFSLYGYCGKYYRDSQHIRELVVNHCGYYRVDVPQTYCCQEPCVAKFDLGITDRVRSFDPSKHLCNVSKLFLRSRVHSMYDLRCRFPKASEVTIAEADLSREDVELISRSFPNVQHLRLVRCRDFADIDVAKLIHSCKKLWKITLENCRLALNKELRSLSHPLDFRGDILIEIVHNNYVAPAEHKESDSKQLNIGIEYIRYRQY